MMKHVNLLYMAMLCLLTAGCGASDKKSDDGAVAEVTGGDMFYPIDFENRLYNDPEAEFDTLSYAMGMHHALSAHSLTIDGGVDRDLLISSYLEALNSEHVDREELHRLTVKVNEFNNICYVPYMSKKQRAMAIRMVNPDAVADDTLTLCNDEFTRDEMSVVIGRKMALELRVMQLPLNIYWIMDAFDDMSGVGEVADIDNVMKLPYLKMRELRGYHGLPRSASDHLAAQSSSWLENVSKQEGVVPLVQDGKETVYYRIDIEGNDKHPMYAHDSIYIDYELYSCHGMPIESTESMLNTIDRYISRVADNPEIEDIDRYQLNKNLQQQREMTLSGGATIESLFFDVLGDCLKEIGEGGEITVWLPASHISNVALNGVNLVYPNMGGVINIHLKRVVPKAEQMFVKKAPLPLPITPHGTSINSSSSDTMTR